MVNLLTMMEFATFNYIAPEEKNIKIPLWNSLVSRCGFSAQTKKIDGLIYYKLKRNPISCEKLYGRDEKNTFNFIDIADLHIGHPSCEEEKIKETLRYAEKNNIDFVFIAGDLLDGVHDPDGCDVGKELERQLDRAFCIFKKFPNLKIIAIPGNHEFMFDLSGYINPLKRLEQRLESENCNFKAYDSYIQDFEVAGVIKRMMHLECYYHHDNEISLSHRLYEFNEQSGLLVKCSDRVKRPIRFLQCGHIHKRIEIYDSDFNVYVTQPGSFIREQNFRRPFIHVKGEVLPDLRIVRG